MKLNYKIKIDNPSTHLVNVEIHGERAKGQNQIEFFLPRWSPGSYLMREYSRNLSMLKAETSLGEVCYFEQKDISTFLLDFEQSELNKKDETKFIISYSVFCHELTVRTSHVDSTHAFLHLPTLIMGILGKDNLNPTLEVKFGPQWSKLSTALKSISTKRDEFIFSAKNYDELIDSPIEIGCHDTDGFRSFDRDHDLCFYGMLLPNKENIKADIKKIVEYIGNYFGGVPYDNYTFITHFVPGLYGGLEHLNSTALQFCPTQINNRKGYLNYICLVSHEYFHLWNVKRIRPLELGPFNYLKEATTHLLWLAEGLTSLMDELFVYRAGLMTLEEYLDLQKDNLNRYLNTPGRKFHSLNDSSMNAWIKLYRPDENLSNSSVSYYLKGGIVFWLLNFLLSGANKSIDDVLLNLWQEYKKNPSVGFSENDIYKIIESHGGVEIRNIFEEMVTTTKELALEKILLPVGISIEWDKTEMPWLGAEVDFIGDRVVVKSVILDGPAYKCGLNAGDEILAVNGMRLLKERFNDYQKYLRINESYRLQIARLGYLSEINLILDNMPAKIKNIKIEDRNKIENCLKPRL